jgi:hypothetical protein
MTRRSRQPPKPFNAALHVDLSGPFFQKDPAKTILQNEARMMVGLAAEGEKMVHAGWTNSIRGNRGVVGRAMSMRGNPWKFHATVTPEFVYPWPKGAPKQYRGGRNKMRTRAFRDATYRMRAAVMQVAFAWADLTKGLE